MKPPPFTYHAPSSLEEALQRLADLGPDARVLAGGQSLLPMLNYRLAEATDLVDVCRIPALGALEATNSGLRIGAAVRQRDVETSPAVQRGWPLLAEAIGFVGHPQIRNRGTVGGSLAHADPSAELPATMVALDAEIVVRSAEGSRRVPAEDFFLFHFTTALEEHEVLEEIHVPALREATACSFQEVATRPGDFAIVAVAVRLSLGDDGTVGDARIVCAGTAPHPQRITDAEARLVGTRPGVSDIADAAAVVGDTVEPRGDAHASAAYRRRGAAVLTRRGIERALAGHVEER